MHPLKQTFLSLQKNQDWQSRSFYCLQVRFTIRKNNQPFFTPENSEYVSFTSPNLPTNRIKDELDEISRSIFYPKGIVKVFKLENVVEVVSYAFPPILPDKTLTAQVIFSLGQLNKNGQGENAVLETLYWNVTDGKLMFFVHIFRICPDFTIWNQSSSLHDEKYGKNNKSFNIETVTLEDLS